MKRGNVIANMDWPTVLLYLIMIILGWLNIYSAVYSDSNPDLLDFSQRHGKQFLWMIASVIIAIIILKVDPGG